MSHYAVAALAALLLSIVDYFAAATLQGVAVCGTFYFMFIVVAVSRWALGRTVTFVRWFSGGSDMMRMRCVTLHFVLPFFIYRHAAAHVQGLLERRGAHS